MIRLPWSTSAHPWADRVAGRKPKLLICSTLVHGDLDEPKRILVPEGLARCDLTESPSMLDRSIPEMQNGVRRPTKGLESGDQVSETIDIEDLCTLGWPFGTHQITPIHQRQMELFAPAQTRGNGREPVASMEAGGHGRGVPTDAPNRRALRRCDERGEQTIVWANEPGSIRMHQEPRPVATNARIDDTEIERRIRHVSHHRAKKISREIGAKGREVVHEVDHLEPRKQAVDARAHLADIDAIAEVGDEHEPLDRHFHALIAHKKTGRAPGSSASPSEPKPQSSSSSTTTSLIGRSTSST
jgi:hypothetical protein